MADIIKHKPELKPRKIGTKEPEDLLRILNKIYPEDIANELFKDLIKPKKENTDG